MRTDARAIERRATASSASAYFPKHAESILKFSLQATIVAAGIFAGICLGVAVTGFASLGELTDPTDLANARGFAAFWAFLGTVSIALGALAWWLTRHPKEDEDA